MAKFSRKRIGLIFAGGTILSNNPRGWELVKNNADAQRWLGHVPELHVVADIEPVFVTSKAATEIGPEQWLAIAEAVKDLAPHVDGIVILHGLETIHYTANALSLMLLRPPVPVVLSASPIPRKESSVGQAEFGARANIIIAAQVATAEAPEVCVVFGNRIIRGSQAQVEVMNGSLQVTSIGSSLLGQVDFGTKYYANRSARIKPDYQIYLDPNVLVTTLVPGSGMIPAEQSLLNKVNGVVLRMHQGYFALPDRLVQALTERAKRGMTVVVSTPTPLTGLPKSFILLPNISPSMAVVKTMWVLGKKGRTAQTVKSLLTRNMAGEIVPKAGGRV